MAIHLIIDLVIVLLLVLFAIRGAHRGLVLSLCTLVAVIIAFVGAGIAARTLSPKIANALEPRFAAAIERRLDEAMEEDNAGQTATPEAEDDNRSYPLQTVLNVLRDMGLYENLIDTIDDAVDKGMTEVAANATAKVVAAVARTAAYLIIFIVGFFVILFIWKIISHALDLVTRLPVLHFLNKTLGAAFGLVQCCILLFIIAWVLQFFGNLIPEDTVAKTHLLRFFMTTNPFSLLAKLR